jgi:hypothetical protein
MCEGPVIVSALNIFQTPNPTHFSGYEPKLEDINVSKSNELM